MTGFKSFMSVVILVASIVVLFNKLFAPQPIQITLQSGQEITTSTSEYFSLTEVLLLITCTLLIGATATYLFYNSDTPITKNYRTGILQYDSILPLLKSDEKHVITALLENGRQIQQNKLGLKLGISTVKTTRVLRRLEQKNLISRERHGFTNMVRLRLSDAKIS